MLYLKTTSCVHMEPMRIFFACFSIVLIVVRFAVRAAIFAFYGGLDSRGLEHRDFLVRISILLEASLKHC